MHFLSHPLLLSLKHTHTHTHTGKRDTHQKCHYPSPNDRIARFVAQPVFSYIVRNSTRLETHPLGILRLLICAPAPNAQHGKTIVMSKHPFLPPKSRWLVFMTSLLNIQQTGTPGPLLKRECEEGFQGNIQAPRTFQEGTLGCCMCPAPPDLLTPPQLDFGLNLFFQTKK